MLMTPCLHPPDSYPFNPMFCRLMCSKMRRFLYKLVRRKRKLMKVSCYTISNNTCLKVTVLIHTLDPPPEHARTQTYIDNTPGLSPVSAVEEKITAAKFIHPTACLGNTVDRFGEISPTLFDCSEIFYPSLNTVNSFHTGSNMPHTVSNW